MTRLFKKCISTVIDDIMFCLNDNKDNVSSNQSEFPSDINMYI